MTNRALLAVAIALISGQAQKPLLFDAATIKPDHWGPGEGGMIGGPGTNTPGRVRWRFAPLRDLVAMAYHVDPQYVSGPGWITGDNGSQIYVFNATMPPDTGKRDFELMLESFLTDQFKLKIRHESKLFPGYELVVAPGGSHLKPSADTDAPDQSLWTAPKIGADGFPEMPPGHGMRSLMRHGGIYARFQSFTMAELADRIGVYLPRAGQTWYLISDRTGLTGKYDFTLKFEQDSNQVVIGPGGQPVMPTRDASEPGDGLPTIYKALEQQLGLRMVKTKDVPVDTIVIDHAEKLPVGN